MRLDSCFPLKLVTHFKSDSDHTCAKRRQGRRRRPRAQPQDGGPERALRGQPTGGGGHLQDLRPAQGRPAAQEGAQWKMFEFGGFFMSYVWSRPFPATSSSPSRANEGPASSAQPWPMAYRPWALAELTRLGPFVDTGRLVRSSRKLPRDRVTVNQKSPPNSNVSLCVFQHRGS